MSNLRCSKIGNVYLILALDFVLLNQYAASNMESGLRETKQF